VDKWKALTMQITIEIPTEFVTQTANAALKTAFSNERHYGQECEGFKLVSAQVNAQIRELDLAPFVAEELKRQLSIVVREVVSEELRKRIKTEVKTLAKDGLFPSA
jgi:hypothetical protein